MAYFQIKENNNILKIIYKINPYTEKRLKIFGDYFVKKNSNRCNIIYRNKKYSLKEYFDDINFKNDSNHLIIFKLNITDNIIDKSFMFHKCDSLISVSEISKYSILTTKDIHDKYILEENSSTDSSIQLNYNKTNENFTKDSSFYTLSYESKENNSHTKEMEGFLNKDYSLSSIYLPNINFSKSENKSFDDIDSNVFKTIYKIDLSEKESQFFDLSELNHPNLTNISYIFYGCNSLVLLPDISQWNISTVNDMSYMFYGCHSLISLPDISQWNTINITNIEGVFQECKKLNHIPEISRWDTSNVYNMNSLFYMCRSLKSLPDLSKWDTSKVINMSHLFYKCNLLKSIPDISKWEISNVKYINYIFSECRSLISLPNISKWNTQKLMNMKGIFQECRSLISIPEISDWDISKISDLSYLFYKCISISVLPDLSKWNT